MPPHLFLAASRFQLPLDCRITATISLETRRGLRWCRSWARCPTDRHLYLLVPAEAQAAGIEGHGRAGCGRLIPRAGLMIDGASVAGWCVSCLAAGTAS
ncbi:MAG: hypothetical protein ACRDTJ_12875 [Pseudonocardiaceae bacterium]